MKDLFYRKDRISLFLCGEIITIVGETTHKHNYSWLNTNYMYEIICIWTVVHEND